MSRYLRTGSEIILACSSEHSIEDICNVAGAPAVPTRSAGVVRFHYADDRAGRKAGKRLRAAGVRALHHGDADAVELVIVAREIP